MWELSGQVLSALCAVTCPRAGKEKQRRPQAYLNRCEGLSNVLTNERLVVRCALMEYMITVEFKGQAGNAAGLQGSTDVNIGS